MRGVYTAKIRMTGIAAAKTLLYIVAPSTAVIELLEASVTEDGVTTADQLEIGIDRISALGTPTATSVTPSPTEVGDQASGCTVKGNVTASEPTYSTNLDHQSVFNEAGYYYAPLPEDRDYIPPSGSLGIRLLNPAVPANTYNFVVTAKWREIG